MACRKVKASEFVKLVKTAWGIEYVSSDSSLNAEKIVSQPSMLPASLLPSIAAGRPTDYFTIEAPSWRDASSTILVRRALYCGTKTWSDIGMK
eukprot:2422958-Amphidinium_carterae.1